MVEKSVRYILKLEEDRKAAGWGEHYWIVDTHAPKDNQLLRLVPAGEAEQTVARMNEADLAGRQWH